MILGGNTKILIAFPLNSDELKKAKTKTKTKNNGLRSLKGKKQIHVSAGLIFALIILLNEWSKQIANKSYLLF